ncbi:hypothetical protein LC048_18600 [Mesobacillus subterraneus]|nr:hypothetical protein [Mesobacillus subterraneus]WLR54425.1 hypothetical protein LC048_18600 [Mesobacillus subterraneus]
MTSLAGPKRLEELGAAAGQATRGARRWSWTKKSASALVSPDKRWRA